MPLVVQAEACGELKAEQQPAMTGIGHASYG